MTRGAPTLDMPFVDDVWAPLYGARVDALHEQFDTSLEIRMWRPEMLPWAEDDIDSGRPDGVLAALPLLRSCLAYSFALMDANPRLQLRLWRRPRPLADAVADLAGPPSGRAPLEPPRTPHAGVPRMDAAPRHDVRVCVEVLAPERDEPWVGVALLVDSERAATARSVPSGPATPQSTARSLFSELLAPFSLSLFVHVGSEGHVHVAPVLTDEASARARRARRKVVALADYGARAGADTGAARAIGVTQLPPLAVLELFGAGACVGTMLRLATVTRGALESLTALDLSGCRSLVDADVIGVLGKAPLLDDVVLASCTLLTDDVLGAIAALQHLRVLDLSGLRRLTDAGVAAMIRALPKLSHVGGDTPTSTPTRPTSAAPGRAHATSSVNFFPGDPFTARFISSEQRVAEAARRVVRAPSATRGARRVAQRSRVCACACAQRVACSALQAINVADTSVGDVTMQALGEHAAGLINACVSGCHRVTGAGIVSLCVPRSRLRALSTSGCTRVPESVLRSMLLSMERVRTYVWSSAFRKYEPFVEM